MELFVTRYIEDHESVYINRLAEWVAIQSVSGLPNKRDEVVRMVKVVAKVCIYDKKSHE